MRLTRQEFVEQFRGRPISTARIQESELPSESVKKKVRSADVNGDHFIHGEAELNQLFDRLNDFDHDGSDDSIALERGGRALALGRLMGLVDEAAYDRDIASREAPGMEQIPGGAVLSLGHEGPAVQELQDRLTQLGFGVSRSGKMGPSTVETLRRFQKTHGVAPTGKLGKTTLQALENAEVAPRKGYPSLKRTMERGVILARGAQGAAVADLQHWLRREGYEAPISGRFDADTEAALKAFQGAHDVGQTGKVGPTTLGALRRTEGVFWSDTQGMSEAQKYDYYRDLIEEHGSFRGEPGRRNLISLRRETDTDTNGGHGSYDDRTAMVWVDAQGGKHVREFRSNTEPNASYRYRYGVDANGDGIKDQGRLPEGYYEYATDYDPTFGDILYPVQHTNAERDTNHDGLFNDGAYASAGDTILFHAGGVGTTGSAGCQTMEPAEYRRFWSDLNASGSPGRIGYTLLHVQD